MRKKINEICTEPKKSDSINLIKCLDVKLKKQIREEEEI